jgi:hypothetical protein
MRSPGRWQFSLAQLLVVITALAIGLGAGLFMLGSFPGRRAANRAV